MLMPLNEILANYEPGDGGSWQDEFEYLWKIHPGWMKFLCLSIQKYGILKPVLLGYDGRLWDGHHRLAAAEAVGIPEIPVEHVSPEKRAT